MKIIKLTLIESPGFNDGMIKSYDTNLRSGMIEDALARTEGGRRMDSRALSGIAAGMVRPGASGHRSHIENGWQEKRMRYALLVQTQDRQSRIEYKYITGYTDGSDFSVGRDGRVSLNPNTRFYFNSISTVDMFESATHSRGNRYVPRLSSHDQVLSRDTLGREDDKRLLRPVDLFRKREVSDGILERFGDGDHHYSRINNTIGRFSSKTTLSTRANNSPSSYLSRSLRSYVGEHENQTGADGYQDSFGSEYDHTEMLMGVTSRLRENAVGEDPFFDTLRDAWGDIESRGYMTYGELLDTDPEFDEDTMVGLQPSKRGEDYRYIDTDDINANTPEAIAANILAQSIPAVMLNAMYSKVNNLIINSAARMGEERVIPSSAYPFVDGLDVISTDGYFIDQIEYTVLPDVTCGGSFDVEALVNCDIDGVTDILISVDGGPEHHYVVPVFADGLLTPVMTLGEDHLDRISEDIISISEAFYLERDRNNPREIDERDARRRDSKSQRRFS